MTALRLKKQWREGKDRNRKINDKFIDHLCSSHDKSTDNLQAVTQELKLRSDNVYDNETARWDQLLKLVRNGEEFSEYIRNVQQDDKFYKDMQFFLNWFQAKKIELGCDCYLQFLSER